MFCLNAQYRARQKVGLVDPPPPPHPPSQRIFGLEKIPPPPQPTQTRESDVYVSRPDILVMVSSTRTVLPAAILKNRTSGRSKKGPGFRLSGSGPRPCSSRNAFPAARFKGPHSAANVCKRPSGTTYSSAFYFTRILLPARLRAGLRFRPGSRQDCASGQSPAGLRFRIRSR